LNPEQALADFLKSVEKRAFKRTAFNVRDDESALDIVQDAMIRLAERYADRPAEEWPMLFQRILSNATMDWFRRQKVRNAFFTSLEDLETTDEDTGFDFLEYLQTDAASSGT
jgi:RNA polymerase sigma-70 factor (ECF subfamily)